jgi:hypothetical protein
MIPTIVCAQCSVNELTFGEHNLPTNLKIRFPLLPQVNHLLVSEFPR